MKAIETIWKGYRFRSRLEARWAIFFDHLGMTWEYEPEGFELSDGRRYLPDFRITNINKNVLWYEIKPANDKGDGKIEQLEADYEKEQSAKNYPISEPAQAFMLLSGDPSTVLDAGNLICPRCGLIYHDRYPSPDYFNCWSCDWNCIHSGSNNPKEWGLIAPVSYHKGCLMVDEHDMELYDYKIKSACNASRAARFEHGETA